MNKTFYIYYVGLLGMGAILSLSLGCARNTPQDIPVLMYHSVLPTPGASVWSVSTNEFGQQLADLQAHGYTTILPNDLLRARRGFHKLPRKPIILTFDDGLRNSMTYAEPLLKSYGFQAICYLILDKIGENDGTRVQYLNDPCLTWPEVRDMQKRGTFTFGVHSLSHTRNTQHQMREVVGTRGLFKRHAERKTSDYCYPYGQSPDFLRAAVQAEGFQTAMICEDRLYRFDRTNDLLLIPRVSVYGGEHRFQITLAESVENGTFTAEVVNQGVALPVRAVLRDLASGTVWNFNPPQRLDATSQTWQWDALPEGLQPRTLRVEIWEQNGLFRYASAAGNQQTPKNR